MKILNLQKKNFIIYLSVLIWFILSMSILNSFHYYILKNLNTGKDNINSLTPINIQIITNLKNSNNMDYIQNIYINEKEDNKLNVLIKPNTWLFLKKDQKEALLNEIENIWTIIYKKKYPNSLKKPQVFFSNQN